MVVEYLLIAGAEEMRTSGQYVPRVGESVQLCSGVRGIGMYTVAEVVNWVKKADGREGLDAGLPRVMLLSDGSE